MIIFMTGISMEFSSQFGFITTRGIVAQLFLKILKLVCFKKCVYVKLTQANHYCFGHKRFCQSNNNESFPKKKKKSFPSTFNSKSIHVRRHLAQYSDANFQIFTAAYICDNKKLLSNNNCQHIPNSFFS